MKQKLLLALKRFLSLLPTPLPTGKTQYDTWLSSIIELAGPIADEQSMAWVISNEIMRLKSGQSSVPKNAFVKDLKRFACMQIAANKVLEIKEQQKAAQAAQAAEVTASTAVIDVEQK